MQICTGRERFFSPAVGQQKTFPPKNQVRVVLLLNDTLASLQQAVRSHSADRGMFQSLLVYRETPLTL